MSALSYSEFLGQKRHVAPSLGVDVADNDLHPSLFPHQRDLTRWALRKGRCALFCDTGLGKTRMQLEWARLCGERTLILAPLSVARQTVAEAAAMGIEARYARSQSEAGSHITVTNYEMLHAFDPAAFGAVVLDESSILKAFSGVVKRRLVEAWRGTRYKLCCTATPAPNDVVELCNHADFLEVMKPSDMLSTFFISKGDDQKDSRFRLKRHAREAFFRWLASWSASLTRPGELGYSDDGYVLPPLEIAPAIVESDYVPDGSLFFTGLKGVQDRAAVRAATVGERVAAAVEIVNREPGEQWILWCGRNDEARMLTAAISGAVNVEGAMAPDAKADAIERFQSGEHRVLVTKPTVAGFGMNFQNAARMVFVGLGDSYEQYYQAIRRCYRFGQRRPVKVHIVLSDPERAVFENVLRKEEEHRQTMRELIAAVVRYERAEIGGQRDRDDYQPTRELFVPAWLTTCIDLEEENACA